MPLTHNNVAALINTVTVQFESCKNDSKTFASISDEEYWVGELKTSERQQASLEFDAAVNCLLTILRKLQVKDISLSYANFALRLVLAVRWQGVQGGDLDYTYRPFSATTALFYTMAKAIVRDDEALLSLLMPDLQKMEQVLGIAAWHGASIAEMTEEETNDGERELYIHEYLSGAPGRILHIPELYQYIVADTATVLPILQEQATPASGQRSDEAQNSSMQIHLQPDELRALQFSCEPFSIELYGALSDFHRQKYNLNTFGAQLEIFADALHAASEAGRGTPGQADMSIAEPAIKSFYEQAWCKLPAFVSNGSSFINQTDYGFEPTQAGIGNLTIDDFGNKNITLESYLVMIFSGFSDIDLSEKQEKMRKKDDLYRCLFQASTILKQFLQQHKTLYAVHLKINTKEKLSVNPDSAETADLAPLPLDKEINESAEKALQHGDLLAAEADDQDSMANNETTVAENNKEPILKVTQVNFEKLLNHLKLALADPSARRPFALANNDNFMELSSYLQMAYAAVVEVDENIESPDMPEQYLMDTLFSRALSTEYVGHLLNIMLTGIKCTTLEYTEKITNRINAILPMGLESAEVLMRVIKPDYRYRFIVDQFGVERVKHVIDLNCNTLVVLLSLLPAVERVDFCVKVLGIDYIKSVAKKMYNVALLVKVLPATERQYFCFTHLGGIEYFKNIIFRLDDIDFLLSIFPEAERFQLIDEKFSFEFLTTLAACQWMPFILKTLPESQRLELFSREKIFNAWKKALAEMNAIKEIGRIFPCFPITQWRAVADMIFASGWKLEDEHRFISLLSVLREAHSFAFCTQAMRIDDLQIFVAGLSKIVEVLTKIAAHQRSALLQLLLTAKYVEQYIHVHEDVDSKEDIQSKFNELVKIAKLLPKEPYVNFCNTLLIPFVEKNQHMITMKISDFLSIYPETTRMSRLISSFSIDRLKAEFVNTVAMHDTLELLSEEEQRELIERHLGCNYIVNMVAHGVDLAHVLTGLKNKNKYWLLTNVFTRETVYSLLKKDAEQYYNLEREIRAATKNHSSFFYVNKIINDRNLRDSSYKTAVHNERGSITLLLSAIPEELRLEFLYGYLTLKNVKNLLVNIEHLCDVIILLPSNNRYLFLTRMVGVKYLKSKITNSSQLDRLISSLPEPKRLQFILNELQIAFVREIVIRKGHLAVIVTKLPQIERKEFLLNSFTLSSAKLTVKNATELFALLNHFTTSERFEICLNQFGIEFVKRMITEWTELKKLIVMFPDAEQKKLYNDLFTISNLINIIKTTWQLNEYLEGYVAENERYKVCLNFGHQWRRLMTIEYDDLRQLVNLIPSKWRLNFIINFVGLDTAQIQFSFLNLDTWPEEDQRRLNSLVAVFFKKPISVDFNFEESVEYLLSQPHLFFAVAKQLAVAEQLDSWKCYGRVYRQQYQNEKLEVWFGKKLAERQRIAKQANSTVPAIQQFFTPTAVANIEPENVTVHSTPVLANNTQTQPENVSVANSLIIESDQYDAPSIDAANTSQETPETLADRSSQLSEEGGQQDTVFRFPRIIGG